MPSESNNSSTSINLQARPDIKAVWMILEDGTELPLIQRPLGNTGKPGECTFIPEVVISALAGELPDPLLAITLRLDWGDMTSKGDPELDADIFKGKKEYKVKRGDWHHTSKKIDNGEWTYTFTFENICLRFKVGIMSERTMEARACIAPASEDAKTLVRNLPWGGAERLVFCASCQAETVHKILVDHNNEVVTECPCGRFLKFRLTETEEDLVSQFSEHAKANRR